MLYMRTRVRMHAQKTTPCVTSANKKLLSASKNAILMLMKRQIIAYALMSCLFFGSCAHRVTLVSSQEPSAQNQKLPSKEEALFKKLLAVQQPFFAREGIVKITQETLRNGAPPKNFIHQGTFYLATHLKEIGISLPYAKLEPMGAKVSSYEFLEQGHSSIDNALCIRTEGKKQNSCEELSLVNPSLLSFFLQGTIPLPQQLLELKNYPKPSLYQKADSADKQFVLFDEYGLKIEMILDSKDQIQKASLLYAKQGQKQTGPWYLLWTVNFERTPSTIEGAQKENLTQITFFNPWFAESNSEIKQGVTTVISFSSPPPTTMHTKNPTPLSRMYLEQFQAKDKSFPVDISGVKVILQDEKITATTRSIIGNVTSLDDIQINGQIVPTPSFKASAEFLGMNRTLYLGKPIEPSTTNAEEVCLLIAGNNKKARYNFSKMSAAELTYALLGMVALPAHFKEASWESDSTNPAQTIVTLKDDQYQILTITLGPNFYVRKATRSYKEANGRMVPIWDLMLTYPKETRKDQQIVSPQIIKIAGTYSVKQDGIERTLITAEKK